VGTDTELVNVIGDTAGVVPLPKKEAQVQIE
jgi:hypothetical protein